MKKNVFLLMGIAAMFVACENQMDEQSAVLNQEQGKKMITFACEGDFGNATFTRGTLTADSKNMSDLWVLDYVGGTLQQQLHQVSTDEDFGTPSLNLDYGAHHIYFVASRGDEPTLSTTDHKISWTKPLDTFYKDFSITVTAGTSSSHNVTLERAVTKLKITVNDEIPAGLATITITPGTWYYGIDYLTGGPTEAKTSDARAYNIPSSYVGTMGEVSVNMYGFSGATEWTTDVTVVAKNSSSETIGTANITGAPFKVNRVTNYNGNLFVNAGGFSLALSGEWDDEYSASW
jgi:hypothetical protein